MSNIEPSSFPIPFTTIVPAAWQATPSDAGRDASPTISAEQSSPPSLPSAPATPSTGRRKSLCAFIDHQRGVATVATAEDVIRLAAKMAKALSPCPVTEGLSLDSFAVSLNQECVEESSGAGLRSSPSHLSVPLWGSISSIQIERIATVTMEDRTPSRQPNADSSVALQACTPEVATSASPLTESSSFTQWSTRCMREFGVTLLKMLEMVDGERGDGWVEWTQIRTLVGDEDSVPDNVWSPPELIVAVAACLTRRCEDLSLEEVTQWLESAAAPRPTEIHPVDVVIDSGREKVMLTSISMELSPQCIATLDRAASPSRSTLHHANIASVLGVAAIGGEFVVEGERSNFSPSAQWHRCTLRDQLDAHLNKNSPIGGGPLGWPRFCSLGLGVADALEHGAKHGFSAWVLDPQHILMDDKRPVLIDVGIVQQPTSSSVCAFGRLLHLALGSPSNLPDEAVPESVHVVLQFLRSTDQRIPEEFTTECLLQAIQRARAELKSPGMEGDIWAWRQLGEFWAAWEAKFCALRKLSGLEDPFEYEDHAKYLMELVRDLRDAPRVAGFVAKIAERLRQSMLELSLSLANSVHDQVSQLLSKLLCDRW